MVLPIGNLEKVRALAISGRVLAVGGVRATTASQIVLFDHVGDKAEKTIDVPAHVLALAGDEDGFVAACADGVLRFYDRAGTSQREVAAHRGAATSVVLREGLVVSGGADGFLRTFARKSGAKKKELSLSGLPLRAVAIDAAGEAVAGGGDDGIVRVVWFEGDRKREMPGHDGAVTTLAFTRGDGRVVSGGEDGTVRLWYLSGAIEADVRGKDDAGHAGGVSSIVFLPTKAGASLDEGERFVTAGIDGKLRLWRTSDRRRPRGLDTKGPVHALALGAIQRSGISARLFAAGDPRTVSAFTVDAEGEVKDARDDYGHGFDVLASELAASARSKREAAIRTLAALPETEALELAIGALEKDREAEARIVAAEALAENDRRDARKALRGRLDDGSPEVRKAALAALRKLEADAPLAPLRAALDSKFVDVRVAGLAALPPLFATSPLVQGLIAKHLADTEAPARRAALVALLALYPGKPAEPLRTAFERGLSDVRADVLVRGLVAKLDTDPAFAPVIGKALDDADAEVRRIAFVVVALSRPRLVAWLEPKDEAFGRALTDVVRRAAEAKGVKSAAAVPADLDPTPARILSISAMFVQFEHPTHGNVAIFKPTIHTPLAVGDEVYLVGVGASTGNQVRARDYFKGELSATSDADLAAIRASLAPSASGQPDEADREPLLAALACRTPDTSLRGARGLALLGDMRALGALLTISREPEAALRREAAVALVALQDRRAEKRLAWMTSDPDAEVRSAALASYAKLEPDPLALAKVALESAYEDVRVRGLDLLVKDGKGKARAEELLQGALEDEAAKVRSEAFRTLWAWHDKDPLGPLDRALTARFPDLRAGAVKELSRLSKEEGPLKAQASERVANTIADRDAGVARAAYDATVDLRGKADAKTYLAAMTSTVPALRIKGAKDAENASFADVRSALTKLLEDKDPGVRIAAIETLDKLSTTDLGALYVGLQSSFLDLRVRAAELLAARRDEQIVLPMQALIADKELLERQPALVTPLRQRASAALANLGAPKLLRYFATDLVKDDDGLVREQGARGVSNASRRGEEGFLLDLLGHQEIAVRSWAAEGLARLGDARALPVLTGTLRHEHPPIRVGAILSFAALGPEGYGGMLQGLEDTSRDVQRIVLSVILARDLRAFRAGEPPELLASALSSQRPEVRFAAARALELRIEPDQYAAHLVELLTPEKPESSEETAKWPAEAIRARLMMGIADALAGDRPEQRYAAAQALRLRDRPLDFFREAERVVRPRSTNAPWVPETSPQAPPPREAPAKKGPLALLRRLFASGPEATEESPEPTPSKVSADEQKRLRLLAFGAYVGLLRQAAAEDEGHRVRRDAIERIVELTNGGHVSAASATPALARALDDPNHLVRRAAFQGLRAIYPKDPEIPLGLALASSASDVVRVALDEIVTKGDAGRPRIVQALDSPVAEARRYAFELLEKTAAPGSLEPLLAALGSAHSDIRIGVLERLATSQDPRVVAALGKALESDHEDLRLRAAELLAGRRDDRAVDVLAASLRSDDEAVAGRARDALVRVGSAAAVAQIAQRFDDAPPPARASLARSLANLRVDVDSVVKAAAIAALAGRLSDEDDAARTAALDAGFEIVGPRADTKVSYGRKKPRAPDQTLAFRFAAAAVKSRYPQVRLGGVERLDDVDDVAAEGLLVGLFGDRSVDVRKAAVAAYATRVEKKGASPDALDAVVRGGARETMLAAAEGLATKQLGTAFRPLLLFVRAGEEGERERALLALGTLGDKRALAELEIIANGGTEEAPAEEPMQAAAIEALGRLFAKLDPDDRDRVRERIEGSIGARVSAFGEAAVRGLRYVADERARARLRVVVDASENTTEREEAARALGALRDVEAEKALVKALDDWDSDVRGEARLALDAIFPDDRTRVELHAIESQNDDICEPAALYLASEGDPAAVLAKLAKIEGDEWREFIRFGLARRAGVPASALTQLLTETAPSARADAAWLAAVRADDIAEADRVLLGVALVDAAAKAEAKRAASSLDASLARDEEKVAVLATAAARRLGAAGLAPFALGLFGAKATDVPASLRVEALRAFGAGSGKDAVAAAKRAFADSDLAVRAEAAAALGRMKVAVADVGVLPSDPVNLRIVAEAGVLPDAASTDRRAVGAPLLLARGDVGALVAVANGQGGAKDGDRLDAIAALGLSTTSAALDALAALSAEGAKHPVEIKKAAYRSLRRAQRAKARTKEATA